MDLRQLEYFVKSVEEKSFLRAAEKLFTSQPNISKSIAKLEKEIGVSLLNRIGKGVIVTQQGEKFYHYAKNILQQVEIMKDFSNSEINENLSVCSYPSNVIARTLVDLYKECDGSLRLQYHEGTVQEVINWVSSGICEVGIVYVAKNQTDVFEHIISHNGLEFVELKQKKLCVYVGENSPLYNKTSISAQALSQLKFVRGVRDYFSVEHHFTQVNLNALKSSEFNDIILTNSDHLVVDLLEQTDVCYLGIDFMNQEYQQYKTCMISIDNSENFLTLGYVKHKSNILTARCVEFIDFVFKKI